MHVPDDSDVLRLLLTAARVLRAHLGDPGGAYELKDKGALDEALAPWDPKQGEPVNEANG